jgi:hypothetical protein
LEVDQAFLDLKTAFTMAPILIHLNLSKPFFLENNVLEVVLSQDGEDKRLHHVTFHSQKFIVVEINYDIHDKELQANVDIFQEWRHFLEGAVYLITVYIDYKNLKYFMFA